MQIYIRTPELHLRLPLPLPLFCNGLTARFAATALRKPLQKIPGTPAPLADAEKIAVPAITPAQLSALFRALRQCCREHPGLVLVEVESADAKIKITL